MAQQVKIDAKVTDLLNKSKDSLAAAANTTAPVIKLENPTIALKATTAVPKTLTKSATSPSIGGIVGALRKDTAFKSTGDEYKTLDEINEEIEEPEVVAKPAVIDDGSKTKRIIIIVAVVVAVVAVILAVSRKRK